MCTCKRNLALFVPLCLVVVTAIANSEAGQRNRFELSDGWLIKQLETPRPDVAALTLAAVSPDESWLRTRVPAQVHDVLLKYGRIPDPTVSKNAAKCTWVAEKDWVYACRFISPSGSGGPIFLCFEGIDTLATAYLNGKQIGHFDNMYRSYRVDVTDKLAPEGQENVLLVVFSSPWRYLEQLKVPPQFDKVPKTHFLRKCHSDFGSYLGARPHFVKVGIFRPVYLDLCGPAWLDDVWVRTKLASEYEKAVITVVAYLGGKQIDKLHWELIDSKQQLCASGEQVCARKQATWQITVENPKLWWPRTHGQPYLYTLNVLLLSNDEVVDRRSVRFGIREVKLVLHDPETDENRFQFCINGQPIFLRGADLAPIEGMTHCWNAEKASRLLDLMELGRMNVLRIWGEGNIPPQSFYDECDRRGILIWQDFMFGYGMHPSGLPEFDRNCRLEIEQMVCRLRNHPCLLLWVGGNENHMGWNFRFGGMPTVGTKLFDQIMPETVHRLDPDRHFHPSSPYGGPVPNWPLEGDWHDYTTLKFCPYASVPLYASEVGRVSAPSLRSMRRFLSPEELWPDGWDPAITTPGRAAWPPMWQYRSVNGSWDKVGPLNRYCDPRSAADLIRVLGTAHGEYLQERVERHRRGVPNGQPVTSRRCWGNMVWRLNDSWPIIYWSIVDYYLEPKMAYYYLRRAYDPVLLCFERTDDQIFAWVVNDSPETTEGTLVVKRRTWSGRTIGQLAQSVRLAPGEAKRVLATDPLGPIVLRKEFLQAELGERVVTYLLTDERWLHLPEAHLQATVENKQLVIRTDAFARQVTIDAEEATGAVFEDNYFDLPPGITRRITLVNTAGAKQLVVSALNAKKVLVPLIK